MSVEPVVHCDGKPGGPEGPTCPRRGYGAMPWHKKSATHVRRWLRNTGWHRTRDGRDICPDCWSAGSYKSGATASPNWCVECRDYRPCVCDGDDLMPIPDDYAEVLDDLYARDDA